MDSQPKNNPGDSAYILQFENISQSIVIETLLREYYSRIHRFLSIILNDEDTIRFAAVTTFSNAVERRHKYNPEQNPIVWLMAHALATALTFRKSAQSSSHTGGFLTSLPDSQRVPFLLFVLEGFNIKELSFIFNESESNLQKRIRETYLLVEDAPEQLTSLPSNQLDSLIFDEPSPELSLWTENLYSLISEDHPLTSILDGDLPKIIREVEEKKRNSNKIPRSFSIILLVLMITFSLVIAMNWTDLQELIGLSKLSSSEAIHTPKGASSPHLSTDASKVTFVSYDSILETDRNSSADIYIYNVENGQISVVTERHANEEILAPISNPRIIPDSEVVIFVSHNNESSVQNESSCTSRLLTNESCANIFTAPLESNNNNLEISLISTPQTDEGTTGDSFAVETSPDGDWIAYWSSARNLVGDDDVLCESDGLIYNCLDIFIHNIPTDYTYRIPVGRARTINSTLFQLDLSNNARFLMFTAHITDANADQFSLVNEQELVIYDLYKKTFELVNVTNDGSGREGISYNGAMSDNGFWITYSAQALQEGASENEPQIFIRDRKKGETQLITLTEDGHPFSGANGIIDLSGEVEGDQITISSDGRYVVYPTTTTFLIDGNAPWWCNRPISSIGFCTNLVLYDTDNETHQLLISNSPPNSRYIFPSISPDGSKILYLETTVDADHNFGTLWLFDRRTNSASVIH